MEPTQPTTRHDDDDPRASCSGGGGGGGGARSLARSLARARAVAVAMAVAIAAYDARAFDDARALHVTLTRGVCDDNRAQRPLANLTHAFTTEQKPPFSFFFCQCTMGHF